MSETRSAPLTSARPVLLVTPVGVEVRQRTVSIDRKFHTGMMGYASRLPRPMCCAMPVLSPGRARSAMDQVEVPYEDLPYRIHVIPSAEAKPEIRRALDPVIRSAALVYLGCAGPFNHMVAGICRELRIPYVANSEYTLRTELDIMRATTSSLPRRVVRELRLRAMHRKKLQLVAHAAAVHANGYPTYVELRTVNPSALLYLDTRSLASDVIGVAAVERRLDSLQHRAPRILFSGRYHAMKGVLDVIRAAVALDRFGMQFTLDTYGTGPLRQEMLAIAETSAARAKIRIHEAVPFKPDLVAFTRDADLFLSGHVQGDPSCTYLETFACGVPIVGYANEMWEVLCRESSGGRTVSARTPDALASSVMGLLRDRAALRAASLAARDFAAANTMETAWERRVAHLAELAAASDTRH